MVTGIQLMQSKGCRARRSIISVGLSGSRNHGTLMGWAGKCKVTMTKQIRPMDRSVTTVSAFASIEIVAKSELFVTYATCAGPSTQYNGGCKLHPNQARGNPAGNLEDTYVTH